MIQEFGQEVEHEDKVDAVEDEEWQEGGVHGADVDIDIQMDGHAEGEMAGELEDEDLEQ